MALILISWFLKISQGSISQKIKTKRHKIIASQFVSALFEETYIVWSLTDIVLTNWKLYTQIKLATKNKTHLIYFLSLFQPVT